MKLLLYFSLFTLHFSLFAQEYRFPKPEFESGYQIPQTTTPLPTAFGGLFWSVVLVLLLWLTYLVVYKWRSRKLQVVLLLASIALFGFYRNGCICSVGSIQNVSAAIFDSSFPLSIPTVIFFGLPLLLTLFYGRISCGAACPLGALQELLHFKSLKVPFAVDRMLRMGAVLWLLATVLLASSQAAFITCEYDPFVGIFRLAGPQFMIIAGVVLLIVGLFISRPYCRYMCPYGVLLRWGTLFSSKKVSITPSDCINCRLCENACPNDAIVPPADTKKKESRRDALQRVKWLIGLTPAVMAIAFLAGTRLGPVFALLHPKVKLFNALEQYSKIGGEMSNEVVAFLASGTPVETLTETVNGIMDFMSYGAGALSAAFGLIVIIELIVLSRRNENKDYSVNAGDCYCCSRCYSFCPVKGGDE